MLTLMTSMVSHLTTCGGPLEIVCVSTEQTGALCQYLRMISSCSQSSATHVIMKNGANIDDYLAVLDFVPSQNVQLPRQAHANIVRERSQENFMPGSLCCNHKPNWY